jgi:hypothetical protein
MKSKYTPGPWSADECRSGFAVYAYKSGDVVVRTEDEEGRYGAIDNEANARLIAAAPELLEALQEIIIAADGEGWSQLDASFTKARAAISKAILSDGDGGVI